MQIKHSSTLASSMQPVITARLTDRISSPPITHRASTLSFPVGELPQAFSFVHTNTERCGVFFEVLWFFVAGNTCQPTKVRPEVRGGA